MVRIFTWLSFFATAFLQLPAQVPVLQSDAFFAKENLLEVTLNTNLKRLNTNRKNSPYQSGTITWHNPAGTGDITENIKLKLRGNFRKENCSMASLMLNFKDPDKQSRFRKLGKVKMVAPCSFGYEYDQYVLKEYLIYKMYNLITDASFKVRLLHLTVQDSVKAKKHYKEYAFVIEPADVLAKRKNWVEDDKMKFNTEQTNRAHSTMVFLFQYMVGNTDWSIPFYHNTKLFFPKDSAKTRPYVVPYDFDFSGLVNAPYASQPETTGLTSVTERFYMGYPRTIEELKEAASIFLSKENILYDLVNGFEFIDKNIRIEMVEYLEQFFEVIKNESQMKTEFIEYALRQKK